MNRDKDNEQIEQKLLALESDVIKESHAAKAQAYELKSTDELRQIPAGSALSDIKSESMIKSDLHYFSGIGLILLGLFFLFQHVRVGTGLFGLLGLGSGSFGLLMIPLLIGIGWIIYDSKSKVGYAITSLTCAVIFVAILSSLVMNFPSMSLLGLIMILVPLAAGGAFLLKGVGGPKALEERLRRDNLIK